MVADALVDNGIAEVLVLQADEASLAADRVVVAGGGHADVFVEDDQVLVQVAAGHPSGLSLVRAVLRSPALDAHRDVLDVVVVCSGGYDRYVLSGDREHRWLFTRHFDRRPERAAGETRASSWMRSMRRTRSWRRGARSGTEGWTRSTTWSTSCATVAMPVPASWSGRSPGPSRRSARRPSPVLVARSVAEPDWWMPRPSGCGVGN